MTNEEIAVQILGGSVELCPLLWRQVEKLLHYWARRYYNANRDRFTRHGVELCDLARIIFCISAGYTLLQAGQRL